MEELGCQAYQKYGSIFRIWLTVLPVVVLLEPEQLQIVLSSSKHTEKMYFYKLLHNFIGKGLITSSGKKWKLHRRLLQPIFNISVLESFIETFQNSANLLFQRIQNRTDKHLLNITSLVNESILKGLHEAVLGMPMNEKETSELKSSPFRKGKVMATYRVLHPWLLFNCVYRLTEFAKGEMEQQQRLVQFATEAVREKKKSQLTGSQHRNSFLDMILEIAEANPSFTEEDVIQELCTFMLAGQDTVAATLVFCLFELAQHPEIQQQAVQEVEDILGTENKTPSLNDLHQMKYLEQVIKETMRLYPSVPFMFRKLEHDINIGKHTVPGGTGVMISPFAVHRLSYIYPQPEKFDPNRFLPECVEKRHPYAFIPFSAGPRNCIGYKYSMLEMKTVLATILRKFWVTPVPGRKPVLSYRVTLRASGGVWLNFVPRDSKVIPNLSS